MRGRLRARLLKTDVVRLGKAGIAITLLCALLSASTPTSVASVDAARYLQDVQMLAAPNMEGRGAGTKGLAKASRYIEQRYKSLHLQPAGTGGFLQPFTVTTGAKLKSDNEMAAIEAGRRQALKINQEFEPISFSDSGSFYRAARFCRVWCHCRRISIRRLCWRRRQRQSCARLTLRAGNLRS